MNFGASTRPPTSNKVCCGCACFTLFTVFTLFLSSVLRAGGGTRCEAALRAAGIAPTQLRCVDTHWNQLRTWRTGLLTVGLCPSPQAGYQPLFERVHSCFSQYCY